MIAPRSETWGAVMYKHILVPVDLGDPELAKPAIGTACALAKASGGSVRLVNVMPMTPVMLAEYVPPDFDVQQRKSAEEGLAIVARDCGIEPARISTTVRQGGIYHEVLEEAKAIDGRSDRDDLAPAGDAHLFPRLQCRARGALRQMLGAGRAQRGRRRQAALGARPAKLRQQLRRQARRAGSGPACCGER